MVRKRIKDNVLTFDGPATIRTVGALYDQLSKGLSRHKCVKLDLASLTDVDMSFIQLVLAARKTAIRDGKQLILSAPAEGVLRDTLRLGGFITAEGQPLPDMDFWLKEEAIPEDVIAADDRSLPSTDCWLNEEAAQ